MSARVRVVSIVLTGALASGCAAGGYNAGSLRSRLVRAGVPAKQASCVLDSMNKEFLSDRLDAHADVTGAEITTERRIVRACGLKVAKR